MSLFVRFLFVFVFVQDSLVYLSACAVLLYTVLIVCVPFPVGVWGRMWNSIVSVPDDCVSSTLKRFPACFRISCSALG